MFSMKPYPVFELSFVKVYAKILKSLVRPKNQLRRKEYKEIFIYYNDKIIRVYTKSVF